MFMLVNVFVYITIRSSGNQCFNQEMIVTRYQWIYHLNLLLVD